MSNEKFYFGKIVETDFDTTIEKARVFLKEQGFGIVSEINVQEKIKGGAGKDINRYVILGACNPSGAWEAIRIEENIGVMLPCNVIVRELSDGKVEVACIDPSHTIGTIDKSEIKALADEIGADLRRALEKL